jgi:hypothetical protein
MKFVIAMLIALSSFSVLADSTTCAIVHNATDRDARHTLEIFAGESFGDLTKVGMTARQSWDNKISVIKVNQGCTLIGYQYQDFNINYNTNRPMNGFVATFTNHTSQKTKGYVLNSNYNNAISSLQCFCR